MKMMLGKRDPVVTVLVEITGLLAQVGQHPLVKVGAAARHPGAYLSLVADARQIEYSNFHLVTSYGVAPLLRSPDCSRNRCRTVSGRYGDSNGASPRPNTLAWRLRLDVSSRSVLGRRADSRRCQLEFRRRGNLRSGRLAC